MQQPPEQLLLMGLDDAIESLLPKANAWLAQGGRSVLIASCASIGSIRTLEQWYALKNQYLEQLSLLFILRDEPQLYPLLEGALSKERLAELQPSVFDGVQLSGATIAGPAAWIAEQQQALEALGVTPAKIQALNEEPISSASSSGSAGPGQTAAVAIRVTLQGREIEFGMERDGATLLDAAEDAGLDLPYSCRGGVCSTCRTRVLAGSVSMLENASLDDWEVENGYVLACQAVPTSSSIHISYDEV